MDTSSSRILIFIPKKPFFSKIHFFSQISLKIILLHTFVFLLPEKKCFFFGKHAHVVPERIKREIPVRKTFFFAHLSFSPCLNNFPFHRCLFSLFPATIGPLEFSTVGRRRRKRNLPNLVNILKKCLFFFRNAYVVGKSSFLF